VKPVDTESKQKEFEEAVWEYRKRIIDDFYSRMGSKNDTSDLKKKIVDLFKEGPAELRYYEFLYIVVRKLLISSSPKIYTGGYVDNEAAGRLDGTLRNLAFELVVELERIEK